MRMMTEKVFIFLLFLLFVTICSGSLNPTIRSMEQLMARINGGNHFQCKDVFEEVCPIGCNGRIGEHALSLDKCGVCGGDGSTCADDDGDGCDSTCLALAIGIPVLIVILIGVACLAFFLSAAARRRRKRRRARRQVAASHYQNQINGAKTISMYGRKQSPTHRKVSKIHWTNGAPEGWRKGNKIY